MPAVNPPVLNYTTFGDTYPDFINQQLLNAQVIAANGNAIIQVPQLLATAKARLVVVTSAMGGTSPTLSLTLAESIDGVNVNPTAAIASGSIAANGVTYGAVATGPIFNQFQLAYALTGAGATFTVSAWLLAWNR